MKLYQGNTPELTLVDADSVGDFKLVGTMIARIISKQSPTKGKGIISGVHAMPKATGSAIGQLANVYWNSTNNNVTSASSGNTLIGKAFKAAATGATEVEVILNGLPDYTLG